MSGMIRLRPTQILLTSEEVSKALHKLHPSVMGSLSSSSTTLQWDHNITVRKNRNVKEANKIAQNFTIHEDLSANTCEVDGDAIDTGEISDMSDFSFGPILFRRSLSSINTLFAEANSSSEAGDEGNDDERSNESVSWDEEKSVTTLASENPTSDNYISSTLIDGSISSADKKQNLSWEANSDDLAEHGSDSVQGDSFIDIEYMADVELSVPGDSSSSAQDSDLETHLQESYSLPMDGESEETISQKFEDMNLYASPAVPLHDEVFHSQEFPASETPGTPSTPAGVSPPPTPHSVRRLLEEVSPRLGEVAGLSPRHAAVSRARLARYRLRSHQHSVLMGQAADFQTVGGYHQQPYTSGASQQWLLNSSPPRVHVRRHIVTIGAGSMADELYDTNTDDSDGGIEIPRQASKTGVLIDEGKKDETGDLDSRWEDAARKLFG